MIGFVSGKIVEVHEDSITVLTSGGVGYRVHVSFGENVPAPVTEGDEISLYTSQYFRENEQGLYGFYSPEERGFFELLVTVSGIGPKLAAALLSNIDRKQLAEMIVNEDVAGLVAVPGVGKKMAERLIVELRDKALGEGPSSTERRGKKTRPEEETFIDQALERLGFNASERDDMLKDVESLLTAGDPVEDILKKLLSNNERR